MPLPGSAAGSFRGPSSRLSPDSAVERGAALAAAACILGDINCDGIVDIRDYGVWRQQFGATDCGNLADLDADCMWTSATTAIWRQNFGQTGPTPGRAYVANFNSNSVTVIDTTTNTVVGSPIPVGSAPRAWASTRPSTAPTSPMMAATT